MSRSPTDMVVRADICIGCGVCAAVCKAKVLRMRFNRFGEYIPVPSDLNLCQECGDCLNVCPFAGHVEGVMTPNEDSLARDQYGQEPGVRYRIETGYYVACAAGHAVSDDLRLGRSAGGLATWLLQALLRQGAVDRVIAVMPNAAPGRLFRYAVAGSPADLLGSAKSCYYPVELSEVLAEVLRNSARYALIGLPCFVKAVRLAAQQKPVLSERIRVLAGLVCGGTRSRLYADYLSLLGGGKPGRLMTVDFRAKAQNRPANDFGFQFRMKPITEDTENAPLLVYGADGRTAAWNRGYFQPNACSYCDDTFAEVADVVFMDAWLKPYIQDPKGTSLVLMRRQFLLDSLHAGARAGEIMLTEVPVTDVIRSQQAVIENKRTGLAERLALAQRLRWTGIPRKRVRPGMVSGYRLLQLWFEHQLRSRSKTAFLRARLVNNLTPFRRGIRLPLLLLKSVNYLPVLVARIGRKRVQNSEYGLQNAES